MHKCCTVHSDIKQQNILLDRDGHHKLTDFGLCDVRIFKGRLTDGVCGTVPYMAPEVHQGLPYGCEVDWWSVGCVTYDMMTGKCRSKVLVPPKRYPPYMMQDAVSILRMFLNKCPRHRKGAHGDTFHSGAPILQDSEFGSSATEASHTSS
jgi:serine/threonine protein kinase